MRTKHHTMTLTLLIALVAVPAWAREAPAPGGATQSGPEAPEHLTVTSEQAVHWRVIEETVAGIAYCNRSDFLDPTYALPVLDWSRRHLNVEGRPLIDQYARAVREAVGRRRVLNGEVPAEECARFDGAEGARTRDAFMSAVHQLDIVVP